MLCYKVITCIKIKIYCCNPLQLKKNSQICFPELLTVNSVQCYFHAAGTFLWSVKFHVFRVTCLVPHYVLHELQVKFQQCEGFTYLSWICNWFVKSYIWVIQVKQSELFSCGFINRTLIVLYGNFSCFTNTLTPINRHRLMKMAVEKSLQILVG